MLFARAARRGAVKSVQSPARMLSWTASTKLRPLSTNSSKLPDLAAENERLRREVADLRAAATAAARADRGAACLEQAAGHAKQRPSPAKDGPRDDTAYSMFVGARSEFTTELAFWDPESAEAPPNPMPCFRLIDDVGQVRFANQCARCFVGV